MDKIKVTHSEYNKILKEQVGIYWNRRWTEIPSGLPEDEYWEREKPISLDMDAELEKYEVIPVEVDHPNEKIVSLIQKLCNESNGKTYTGFILGDSDRLSMVMDKLDNWNFMKGDAINHSYIYEADGEPTVICNYCEGDVTFEIK